MNEDDVVVALTRMGVAVNALRLEVPREVADDVATRFRELAEAVEYLLARERDRQLECQFRRP